MNIHLGSQRRGAVLMKVRRPRPVRRLPQPRETWSAVLADFFARLFRGKSPFRF